MKKIFVATVLFCILLMGQAAAFTFEKLNPEDIFTPEIIEQEKVSDWAKDEIELARAAGLITVHTNAYMTQNITRFQFAELVVNLTEKIAGREITPAADTTFTDSKETAVLKAYAAGIVDGVGNHQFAPGTTTNREQIAAMLYRAIIYIQTETDQQLAPKAADIAKFTDKAKVSAWAVQGVGTLAANGIMSGTSATTLSPKASCTIEQSILLVYRLYENTK